MFRSRLKPSEYPVLDIQMLQDIFRRSGRNARLCRFPERNIFRTEAERQILRSYSHQG